MGAGTGLFTDFTGANLIGANFGEAKLHMARFIEAALGGANFRGADLREAIFYKNALIRYRF